MGDLQNQIADIVHKEYDKLPRKSKPGTSADGIHDWVPLAGIVAVTGKIRNVYEYYRMNKATNTERFLARSRHKLPVTSVMGSLSDRSSYH